MSIYSKFLYYLTIYFVISQTYALKLVVHCKKEYKRFYRRIFNVLCLFLIIIVTLTIVYIFKKSAEYKELVFKFKTSKEYTAIKTEYKQKSIDATFYHATRSFATWDVFDVEGLSDEDILANSRLICGELEACEKMHQTYAREQEDKLRQLRENITRSS